MAEDAFVAWARKQLALGVYELVIPVTERTLVPLAHGLRPGEWRGRVAMADPRSLEVVLDKWRTVALARRVGVPVPASVVASSPDEAVEHAKRLGYPVVLKPARSIGRAAGSRVACSVTYAHTPEELRRKAEAALAAGEVVLQEYFTGVGVGIELLADRGRICAAFQHQRLHELPLTGGGSCLRKSVRVEPELQDAAGRLMAALRWHGVAMVEFKWDPERRACRLMEVNGRLWGSLPLPVAAGLDFPALLYDLHTGGRVVPPRAVRLGVYCRKLSADVEWYLQVLRLAAEERQRFLSSPWAMVQDLARIMMPRHHFDVQQLRDPVPGVVDVGRIVGGAVVRLRRSLAQRWLLRRQQRLWASSAVRRRLASAERLLFVCYGNINRSALAERLFRTLSAAPGVAVSSAGFHPVGGRCTDPIMVRVAAENGVDLGRGTSRVLDHAWVREADAIFVMDLKNLEQMAREYPEAMDRTLLLGLAPGCRGEGGEIADPYGRPAAAYKRCFDQVRQGVLAMAGGCSVQSRETEDASVFLEQIRRYPRWPDAYVVLSLYYRRHGEIGAAKQVVQLGLRCCGDNSALREQARFLGMDDSGHGAVEADGPVNTASETLGREV